MTTTPAQSTKWTLAVLITGATLGLFWAPHAAGQPVGPAIGGAFARESDAAPSVLQRDGTARVPSDIEQNVAGLRELSSFPARIPIWGPGGQRPGLRAAIIKATNHGRKKPNLKPESAIFPSTRRRLPSAS